MAITTPSSSVKFGRAYQMRITGRSSTRKSPSIVEVDFPLTLAFSVTHEQFSNGAAGDFSLYNLSADNRSEIFFNTTIKTQQYPIELRAGYISQSPLGLLGDSNGLPLIFKGFANVAYTERTGVDLVTKINAIDNGDQTTGQPAVSVPQNFYISPGTPWVDMVRQVMQCLAGVGISIGTVSVTPPPPPVGIRGRVFNGSAWKVLERLADEATSMGARFFVEKGVCNMIGQKDSVAANVLGTLQASTGLLGIPRYTGATIQCSCIFEPALRIGALINLNSSELQEQGNATFNTATSASTANGLCKITAYTHHGTISGVQSGDCISDITLMKVDTPVGAGT